VIDNLKQWPFAERFCVLDADNKIRGSKREEELYTRLRGSGFMIRRLKKDVLKDLPPKAYRMVTFAPTGEQREILKKERAFDAKEILHHGMPVGSALPEIRQEMGIAKVPQVCEYVVGLLDEGAPKVVVFAYHREVLQRLEKKLAKHNPVIVMGGVGNKQDRVDRFQEDPNCRILLGQLTAAGTGFTMTASADVVFAEASWVPGENDQAADRCHRIGQTRGVLIHFVVVEQSLDAYILGAAARKAESIEKVLDRGEAR
jgi:SNF2 family DNA or RNA helicase